MKIITGQLELFPHEIKKNTRSERPNWEEYALLLAEIAALRSEDLNTKVGACILREDNSIASIAYNGAPPGIKIDWKNREEKNKRVVHAEMNALRYLKPGEGKLLACTISPCCNCLPQIAAYGIKKIVFKELYHRDNEDFFKLCKEFGIEAIRIDSQYLMEVKKKRDVIMTDNSTSKKTHTIPSIEDDTFSQTAFLNFIKYQSSVDFNLPVDKNGHITRAKT